MSADEVVIAIGVAQDDRVEARRLDTNLGLGQWRIACTGVDAQLVRVFQRWLALRDREWADDEIRAFGSLLHRCFFGERGWDAIQGVIDGVTPAAVRLELTFDLGSRWAATPWEFMCRPEADLHRSTYLAADKRLLLVRRTPEISQPLPPLDDVKVLVVVSEPKHPGLGEVEYEEVLDTIDATWRELGFTMLDPLKNPTAQALADAVADGDTSPDLVHYMGHGEFDDARCAGMVALSRQDGGTDWVGDEQFAGIVAGGAAPPRAAVLHSCLLGRANFEPGFGGVAAQLVRRGVQSVVAMQYPVTNGTAIDFSNRLYTSFAAGAHIDHAAQDARRFISQESEDRDPRFLGVPVVYAQEPVVLVAGWGAG